jgi:hypothetical protein
MTVRLGLDLTVAGDHRYLPGEEIEGVAAWRAERAPAALELRLFWFTRGKGTEDLEIVRRVAFDTPLAVERRLFKLRLPDEPYTFAGRLVSLSWALELVALPSDRDAARVDIVVGPERRPLVLTQSCGGG